MVPHDLVNNLGFAETLLPQVAAGAITGETVDLQGFNSACFLVVTGDVTAGAGGFTAQEADDDGTGAPDTWGNIAATDLDGAFTAPADDEVQKVGYLGRLRFVRVNAAAATAGPVVAVVVEGHANRAPVA